VLRHKIRNFFATSSHQAATWPWERRPPAVEFADADGRPRWRITRQRILRSSPRLKKGGALPSGSLRSRL